MEFGILLAVLKFTTKILKAKEDQNSWSYIIISKKQIDALKPPGRKSFRVKGFLDKFPIKFRSLLPIGDGRFILPINAFMRKATGKKAGDRLEVRFELDKGKKKFSHEFISCLKDDPHAFGFFKTLTPSHQHYFNSWISSAKTVETKEERLTLSVKALGQSKGYQQMRRENI